MWNEAEEMAYWTAEEDKYYTENIRKKYFDFFDVDSYFDKQIDTVVDIGGGAFGGALFYFLKAKRLILVDALARQFREMGKLQSSIDTITADFTDIPLKDSSADVVFAWNVYDHANSIEHFEDGVFEAMRILKLGGLFFGAFPLRLKANNNHPICITRNLVFKQLKLFNLAILKENIIGEMYYRDNIQFLVARKNRA